MSHPKISGVIDIRDNSKITDEEIVICDRFISGYEVIDSIGNCKICIKDSLIDSFKFSRLKNGGLVVSFDRPWYVLDYKYVIEMNNGNIEYDKISSGRYYTHSEKANKHIWLYTVIICFITLVLMLV
jgi:hypothetical protein